MRNRNGDDDECNADDDLHDFPWKRVKDICHRGSLNTIFGDLHAETATSQVAFFISRAAHVIIVYRFAQSQLAILYTLEIKERIRPFKKPSATTHYVVDALKVVQRKQLALKQASHTALADVRHPNICSWTGPDGAVGIRPRGRLSARGHSWAEQEGSPEHHTRAVFFHRPGEIRGRSFEQRNYRASELNLILAAIVLWNTVYLDRTITTLNQGVQRHGP